MNDIVIHKLEFNYRHSEINSFYVEPVLECIDVKFSIESAKLIMSAEFNIPVDELIYVGDILDIKTCVTNRLKRYFKFDGN
ncbi:MAG: hypothetical protein JWM44_3681 [Bacilli bacterium]|nr:hypothetical protein [Bacilli bacterium]